jgi:hypothetical protein
MESTLLDELIEPITACLTVDAARKIASLRAGETLQKRVDELADKANQGSLTADEREEYDRYLTGFHFVTIIQAHARQLLRT